MLGWREMLVLDILKKYGRAMTEEEIYTYVADEMGKISIYNAVMNLEELNMAYILDNKKWRI